jgi:hypothetical protein
MAIAAQAHRLPLHAPSTLITIVSMANPELRHFPSSGVRLTHIKALFEARRQRASA